MATAEFTSASVIDAGSRRIADLDTEMTATHERNIVELMAIPYGGCWPFKKPKLRTREECEKHYGIHTQHRYSSHWWAERPFRRRIDKIEEIVALAAGAGIGAVRLDEEEAALVGVAGDHS